MTDLTNKQFNCLVVLDLATNDASNHKRWRCKCKCGRIRVIREYFLLNGITKSCGCYRNQQLFKHGHCVGNKNSRTYNSWSRMIDRCFRVKDKSYSRYGGRGILVCLRWRSSFKNFLDDMGERPQSTSLDRINGNGNYEPGNCRWATRSQQNKNRVLKKAA